MVESLDMQSDIIWVYQEPSTLGMTCNENGAIWVCGYPACPSDGHLGTLLSVGFPLESRGGEGVVREQAGRAMQRSFHHRIQE